LFDREAPRDLDLLAIADELYTAIVPDLRELYTPVDKLPAVGDTVVLQWELFEEYITRKPCLRVFAPRKAIVDGDKAIVSGMFELTKIEYGVGFLREL